VQKNNKVQKNSEAQNSQFLNSKNHSRIMNNEKKYNQPQSAKASPSGRFGGAYFGGIRGGLFCIFLFSVFLFTSCDEDRHLDWQYINQQWFEQQRQRIDPETGERYWQESESGLLFRVINHGIGDGTFESRPSIRSRVEVRYEGTLFTGMEFDSRPIAEFAVGAVVPGFTEALQMMQRNAIIQIIIPYHLGYGAGGMGITIPPYSALQFEIELHRFWTN
jgi:hypothetical protein